jgi:glutamine synthetase
MSLWRDGANAFWDASAEHNISPVMSAFLAGVIDTLPAFTALYAPNLNSYRRFARGGLVGEHVGWGVDNRSMALRALTHSPGAIRVETRTPGADVNPYLAIAGVLAGGISGIERGLPAPPPVQQNAYGIEDAPRVPATLEAAIAEWERSDVARDVFGEPFVMHYASMRKWEVDKGRRAVTEWDRRRYFEQV